MSEKLCTACMFCKTEDFGYSNYTVEGSSHECLFGFSLINDDMLADAQLAANKTAETCQFYREGTGIYKDVDGEQEHESIRDWIAMYIKP